MKAALGSRGSHGPSKPQVRYNRPVLYQWTTYGRKLIDWQITIKPCHLYHLEFFFTFQLYILPITSSNPLVYCVIHKKKGFLHIERIFLKLFICTYYNTSTRNSVFITSYNLCTTNNCEFLSRLCKLATIYYKENLFCKRLLQLLKI